MEKPNGTPDINRITNHIEFKIGTILRIHVLEYRYIHDWQGYHWVADCFFSKWLTTPYADKYLLEKKRDI